MEAAATPFLAEHILAGAAETWFLVPFLPDFAEATSVVLVHAACTPSAHYATKKPSAVFESCPKASKQTKKNLLKFKQSHWKSEYDSIFKEMI